MIRQTTAPSRLVPTLITLLALGLTDAHAQPTACGSDIRRIEVNQTTLHYFECGKGEPLIFVHGSLGDLHTFQPQVQAFATSFRVIAYSQHSFPPNAPPRESDMESYEQSRCRSASADHATESHSGASRGQLVWRVHRARAGSVEHPELVRSLVLGEPPVFSLLARTSVGEGLRQSWIRRVIEPSRKAFEGGSLEHSV